MQSSCAATDVKRIFSDLGELHKKKKLECDPWTPDNVILGQCPDAGRVSSHTCGGRGPSCVCLSDTRRTTTQANSPIEVDHYKTKPFKGSNQIHREGKAETNHVPKDSRIERELRSHGP